MVSEGKVLLTLNKLAEIINISIPNCFEEISNDIITDITQSSFNKEINNGVKVYFITQYDKNKYNWYVELAQKGIVIFSAIELKDSEHNKVNYISMPSHRAVAEALYAVARYVKQQIKMPTIGVTGSVGKTTLVSFLQHIFSESNKVFVTGGNLNGPGYISREIFRKYNDKYDYHIQEVGGGRKKGVEDSANIIDVDAFCISNVLPHHLDKYESVEAIAYDKTSFDRIGEKEIFGVINVDDEILRNYSFQSHIVRCGIKNNAADYVVKNIVQNGKFLEMDILHREEITHIKINIPGKHNAYNAVLAFAMAEEWGVSKKDIINGFKKYKSDAIRQSLFDISGRLVYIDCFNVTAASINTCLATMGDFENFNRKIAVLGGENALGEKSFEVNFETGLGLENYDIDEYIVVGVNKNADSKDINWYGDSYSLYKGIKRIIKNKKVLYYDNLEEAAERIVKNSQKGDILLFKGMYRLCFWGIIDRAFGTSFVNYNKYFSGEKITNGCFDAVYYKEIDGSNISKCTIKGNKIKIPNAINGKCTYRIGKGVFSNSGIKEIDLGRSIMNIGKEAFMNCKFIESLSIPNSVLHIEEKAFYGCSSLKNVVANSVEHIESEAFANCNNLIYMELSDTCKMIEENAFIGCENIIIYAPVGTYAINYANEHNMNFRLKL